VIKNIINKIKDSLEVIVYGILVTGMFAVLGYIIKNEMDYNKAENEKVAAMVQRYEMSYKTGMSLCETNVLSQETDVWSGDPYYTDPYYLWNVNFLALKSESDFVVVEQNLPLPVTGTGYGAVMPKDHPRYKKINEVFDYLGDLMGREFIVVDNRQEILGGMTADMADRVPVLELYLAVDTGRYVGFPAAAWADQIGGVLGVEVWWWYDDNAWEESGYYVFLHEIGHLLGLGHVDESATQESVMGEFMKSANHMVQTKTFGLHDLTGLKRLWCTNPVEE